MKINKFFVIVTLSFIVFMGTFFETRAINIRDYMSDLSAWVANFKNTLTQYKDNFLSFFIRKRIDQPREIKTVDDDAADKISLMGQSDYGEMLERMNVNDPEYCKKIFPFMKKFVQNYVTGFESDLVQQEHDIFNEKLKKMRDSGIVWSQITCLRGVEYQQNSNAFLDAWAFLQHLKKFDQIWLSDTLLDKAIKIIEDKFE